MVTHELRFQFHSKAGGTGRQRDHSEETISERKGRARRQGRGNTALAYASFGVAERPVREMEMVTCWIHVLNLLPLAYLYSQQLSSGPQSLCNI